MNLPTPEPPDALTILAARHLDATEGPVQVGSTIDQSTRFAIDRVLHYIARAHNGRANAPAKICELPHRSNEEEDTCEEQRVMAGATEPDTPRCGHCIHPKADHSDCDDQWVSRIVPRRPWCHACDETCDYTPIGDMTRHPMTLTFRYRNHRGESTDRTVLPLRIWHGSTKWHPQPQWLLQAYDTGRDAMRDFAFSGMQDTPVTGATETVHGCPADGSGLTPCCGLTPFELSRDDRMTPWNALVTCKNQEESTHE